MPIKRNYFKKRYLYGAFIQEKMPPCKWKLTPFEWRSVANHRDPKASARIYPTAPNPVSLKK
jgi:hypothetical protein